MAKKKDVEVKEKCRFKLIALVYQRPETYKRYAFDEEEAKKNLTDELTEIYGKENVQIHSAEKDKTKTIKD